VAEPSGAGERAATAARALLHRTRRFSLEVLRAGAQPLRAVRLLLNHNFRRSDPWGARRTARAVACAALVVVASVVLAVVDDSWIPVVVVILVFCAEATTLAWRARRHRGTAEGWPTGSLRPGPESMIDHDHFARRARRDGPIFKTGFLGNPTVCILDLALARELFREHADDLGHAWGPVERFVPGGTIRECREPRHSELRRLHTRALTPAVVRSFEPVISDCVSSQLTTMALDADASGSGLYPLPYLRELVLATWSHIMLGISAEDPAYVEVSSLVSDLDPDRHVYARKLDDSDIIRKLDRFAALLQNALRNRDASGESTNLAARYDELECGALGDPGIVRNLIFETINTRDDMAGLLMWVFKFLVDDPTWSERLRAAGDDGQPLTERFVSETLRLAQSEYLFRRADKEIRFRDVVIPAGWLVRVCIREIHRDPAVFTNPDRFDPDRFLDGGGGKDAYAPFGIDHHSCVGETLARTVARVFATEVVRGFDVETVRDGPIELSVERHWAPSSSWRVDVSVRSSSSVGATNRESGRWP
jgi:cytochrome P450